MLDLESEFQSLLLTEANENYINAIPIYLLLK